MRFLLSLVLLALAASTHADGGLFGTGASPKGKSYGALAYDVNTRTWAYMVKSPDPVRAKAQAAQLCGSGCTVYGPFESCGTVVTNGVDVSYGQGADSAAAEAEAQGKCTKEGGCTVAVWGCNQQAAVEASGYQRESSYRRNYGAITYDLRSGAFGTVWDQETFSGAVALAKSHCGKECRVYAAQAGNCSVLARGERAIAIGDGGEYKTAEMAALAKCGHASCRAVTWFCNSTSQ